MLIKAVEMQRFWHLRLTHPKYFRSCVRVGAGTEVLAYFRIRVGARTQVSTHTRTQNQKYFGVWVANAKIFCILPLKMQNRLDLIGHWFMHDPRLDRCVPIHAFNPTTNSHPRNVVTTRLRFCASWAAASRSRWANRTGAKTCRGSRRARRTRTKTCGGRAAKSTRSGVSCSERRTEHRTHNIRSIHTCLPYTPPEATSYPDRQEPRHTGLRHQPQEQALPDPVKTLDGLSSIAAAAFRKNLRILGFPVKMPPQWKFHFFTPKITKTLCFQNIITYFTTL
jgi:hypothetical protein